MARIQKVKVSKGITWIEVPEINMRVLCGCPPDVVKHLAKLGLIKKREYNNITYETGPNAVLLSDVMIQNGQFANMAEFPLLQMLYNQGMLLPNHPNNTGEKPVLIGSTEQLDAQLEYFYRGNYGLISREELLEAGLSETEANTVMRLKLRFAFGKIQKSEDLIDTLPLHDTVVEIRDGLKIARVDVNEFEFRYKREKVRVDLNLPPGEHYESSYSLGFYNIRREYFAIIQSGQGDGWDINRPSMSSILIFQGKIYLIDAGPNIENILNALGIGISEIEGLFHTHSHDDHFAGITALMRSDRKIKYYSTPLVRASVFKKLSALLGIREEKLTDYFDFQELTFNLWNDIEGLEVKPVFSPHPVENNAFVFRSLWTGGYKIYSHMADMVSLKKLKSMVTDDENKSGLSQEMYDQIVMDYLEPATIKKIDIGGGAIHGDAEDFLDDKSDKIILAHIDRPLTDREKSIGSGAHFGNYDVLIATNQNYDWRHAHDYLRSYFPDVMQHKLRALLNSQVVLFNPETIFMKEGETHECIYLLLTGSVEMLQLQGKTKGTLSAGALIGEISGMNNIPALETYRALNYVRALKIPSDLFIEFVKSNNLYADIENLKDRREFLNKTSLFGENISYPIQNHLAKSITQQNYPKDHVFESLPSDELLLIHSGAVGRYMDDALTESLTPGKHFGEERSFYGIRNLFDYTALEECLIYHIPAAAIRNIPMVNWKLFETFEKHRKMSGHAVIYAEITE